MLHERSVALTVVDEELVNCVQQMHKHHLENPHGRFSRKQAQPDWVAVGEYQLYYSSKTFKIPYDVYGAADHSEKARSCEDELLNSIRLVRIGEEPAITLSNHFMENPDYLFTMMTSIVPDWLNGELKIERHGFDEAKRASTLTFKEPEVKENSKSKKSSKNNTDGQDFFVLNTRNGKTMVRTASDGLLARGSTTSFRDQHT